MADNVTLNAMAGGATVATKDLGAGVHAQIIAPYQQNRQDTYTGAAVGNAVDVSIVPVSKLGMQVKGGTGVPTAWNLVIEGTLDGTNYMTLATHQSGVQNDGDLIFVPLDAPVKKFRSRCVSLTVGGATNVTATIIGEASL